jgi:hypothetical protein
MAPLSLMSRTITITTHRDAVEEEKAKLRQIRVGDAP